ncbi:MAG: hypothetical protein HY722_11495, partial [Planctomycetes bacterium]|nr:hypothetical protein [Planctomycetota bacterium]
AAPAPPSEDPRDLRGEGAYVDRYVAQGGRIDEPYELSEDIATKYRDSFQDLMDLLQEASSRFVQDAQGNLHVQITGIDEESIIGSKLHLEAQDIIKSVNGFRVDNPEQAMQLYNTLRHESEFIVVIERNGREVVRYYRVR